MELSEKRARLRAMHDQDRPLILPNVWDAASARTLAGAGFAALASASHAVADSLGYEDGEKAPAGEMFAAAGRITRSVDVPVSIDAEAGYGLAPDELADRLREAGAAGCNIEDTTHANGMALADPESQAGRIAALRDADRELVINARVDVFVEGRWPAADGRLEEAVTRARAYLDAGADCVYPIGVTDESLLGELVARIPGPVNVLYRPGTPSLARLGELGVARVTFGPGLHRATLSLLGGLAAKIRDGGDPY
jgi:2-methylisocitrate lyase-like PEP mutase family enzyme